MDIFKVIGVGLIGAVIAGVLRQDKGELHIFAVMACGIIILMIILNSLTDVITEFGLLVSKSGVDESLFAGVLKIIGIGYITEYSANICNDYNCSSIAMKLQLAGKVAIFFMAMPVLTSLIEVIAEVL